MIKRNFIRVSLGLLVGFPFNYILFGLGLSLIVFTIVSWAFYIGFYEVVDKVVIRDG